MRIRFAHTELLTGVVVGRAGIAIATLPRLYPGGWRLIVWLPWRRQPIVHPPLPGWAIGGPASYGS